MSSLSSTEAEYNQNNSHAQTGPVKASDNKAISNIMGTLVLITIITTITMMMMIIIIIIIVMTSIYYYYYYDDSYYYYYYYYWRVFFVFFFFASVFFFQGAVSAFCFCFSACLLLCCFLLPPLFAFAFRLSASLLVASSLFASRGLLVFACAFAFLLFRISVLNPVFRAQFLFLFRRALIHTSGIPLCLLQS